MLTVNRLKNLITYYILYAYRIILSNTDCVVDVDLSVVNERYELFFNKPPQNVELNHAMLEQIQLYSKNKNIEYDIIINDNEYIKLKFTLYLIDTVWNYKESNIQMLINAYSNVFNTYDIISNENLDCLLSESLKNTLYGVIDNNKLLFRNLKLNEIYSKIKP